MTNPHDMSMCSASYGESAVYRTVRSILGLEVAI